MEKKILWFDIETAPEVSESEFNTYPKRRLWEDKMIEKGINTTFEKSYMEGASIYPEFSKVVCISYSIGDEIKSLTGEERDILTKFNIILISNREYVLGGFNINNFDIPFLWKRMIINDILPHKKLRIGSSKPWEVETVDVLQIRKQSSFGCSLDLLSMTLLGESPKIEMDGKNIASCYYAGNLDIIKDYCEGDVSFTKRCYNKILSVGQCKPDLNNREVDTQASVDPIDVDEMFETGEKGETETTEKQQILDCGLPF